MDIALEAFGPGRLMFGSDWPVCLQAGGYQQVREIFQRFISDLSPHEQQLMQYENAKNFYNL